jgi:hypothetical protein
MWLQFHGNHTRQLITKTDGYDIRVVAEKLDSGPPRAAHQQLMGGLRCR